MTQMEVMIFITDNSALEDMEQFFVEIEPIPGVFPVAVMDSIVTVTITDNDGIANTALGYVIISPPLSFSLSLSLSLSFSLSYSCCSWL